MNMGCIEPRPFRMGSEISLIPLTRTCETVAGLRRCIRPQQIAFWGQT